MSELDWDSNPDEIMRISKEIFESTVSADDKESVYSQKYAEFKQRYPKLFEMCCNPKCDIKHLEYMIEMMKVVRNRESSYKKASEAVGQHFVNAYVMPVLPESESK